MNEVEREKKRSNIFLLFQQVGQSADDEVSMTMGEAQLLELPLIKLLLLLLLLLREETEIEAATGCC